MVHPAADEEAAQLAEAIRASEQEAIAVAEAAAGCHDTLPSASRHQRTLLQSFCALLLESSTLDRAILTEKNPTLQHLTLHTESWIDWTEEDARVAEAEAAEEARRAAEIAEREAHERAVAEAVADGQEPPAPPVVKKKPSPPPPSSSIALQLKDAHGPAFVSYLLTQCLVHPDPVTHANTALFTDSTARRIGFTLVEIMCHGAPRNLRVVLEWVRDQHGTGRLARMQQERDAGVDVVEELDDWAIDPDEFKRSSTGFVGLKNQAATWSVPHSTAEEGAAARVTIGGWHRLSACPC